MNPRRLLADLHLATSLVLAALLLFFAGTGFVAHHREWFHEKVDRDALGDAAPLGEACSVEALRRVAGAEGAEGARGELLWVDVDARRVACRRGLEVAWIGRCEPATDLGATVEARAHALSQRFGGRRQEPPREHDGDEAHRFDDLYGSTVVTIDADGARTVWRRENPLLFSLVEAHRGRGEHAILVDFTAALAMVVAVTGIALGVQRAVRWRRVLAGVAAVLGVAGLGWLISG